MKKYSIAIALFLSALALSGQDVIWKLTYDVGIPFGDTKEFTDKVSWRGMGLDVDRFVSDNAAIGLSFAWSTFFEKESDSYYERDRLLIHGTQQRYINNIPLLARFSYYMDAELLEPFVSLGVGTVWQEARREIGLWAFSDSYWQFALAPEIGVVLPVNFSYVTAKVRYTHGFQTDGGDGAPTLSYLTVGVGIAW